LDTPTVRLLALSGTHRAASWNTVLFEAMSALSPPGITVTVHRDAGSLPDYLPELEELQPAGALRLRAAVRGHDGVVIASPDLPTGIPHVLKNALDWLAPTKDLEGKPVALISTSARTTYALASLAEVVTNLQAELVPAACVSVILPKAAVDKATLLADNAIARSLRNAMSGLSTAITSRR
jgi:chromate reductase